MHRSVYKQCGGECACGGVSCTGGISVLVPFSFCEVGGVMLYNGVLFSRRAVWAIVWSFVSLFAMVYFWLERKVSFEVVFMRL